MEISKLEEIKKLSTIAIFSDDLIPAIEKINGKKK